MVDAYVINVHLTVHPEITEQPNNSTVTTPMMTQFRCNATGVPRPYMEWYYEYTSVRTILTNGVNNVMIEEVDSGDRVLHSTLTLTTTTHPDDSGNYTCRAVNIVDDNFSSAILNVLCMLFVYIFIFVTVCYISAVNLQLNISLVARLIYH